MWSLVREVLGPRLFRTWCNILLVEQNTTKTNASDDLLFFLLPLDEVSAFLLLVKARNSSLLTGRPISLFWSVYFCGSVNYMAMFTWLVPRWNATGGRVFLKNKISDKLISAFVNEFAVEFESFVLSFLEKYQQFRIWVLGPQPMTLENLHFAKRVKKTSDKWKRPLVLLNIFKIFLFMFMNGVNFSCIPRTHISS